MSTCVSKEQRDALKIKAREDVLNEVPIIGGEMLDEYDANAHAGINGAWAMLLSKQPTSSGNKCLRCLQTVAIA